MPRPPRPNLKQRTIAILRWNERYPTGTRIGYFPVLGQPAVPMEERVTGGAAFLSESLDPVIFIDGRSGYVSLYHCRPLRCQRCARLELAQQIEAYVTQVRPEALRLGLQVRLTLIRGTDRCECAVPGQASRATDAPQEPETALRPEEQP